MTEYKPMIDLMEDFVEERLRSIAEEMEWGGDDLKTLLDTNKELRKKTSLKGVPKRARKDPNEPKRYCSAYIFFTKMERKNIRETHPNATTKEVMALLGKAWGNASKKVKAKFQKESDADKLRYTKEMELWNAEKEAEAAEKEKAVAVAVATAAAAEIG